MLIIKLLITQMNVQLGRLSPVAFTMAKIIHSGEGDTMIYARVI